MGKFLSYCQSLGIKIETNPPHIPQGNAIAERGFGSIFGSTRKLLLGAPHLLTSCGRKPSKPPFTCTIGRRRTSWAAKLLSRYGRTNRNLLHIREWGTLAFKRVEQPDRVHKLAPRAVKMHLVGFNTKSKSYRL